MRGNEYAKYRMESGERVDLQTMETSLRLLWREAVAGNTKSYTRFLHQLSGHVRAFLRKRLAARPDAVEDLVQEILLAVHQKRHTYQSSQPLTAWIFAIARYKWIDHLRSHNRTQALHDDIDDWADQLWTDADSEAQDASKDLHTLLAGLPEKQRLCIEHAKLEGHSIADIARRLGQTESAVKVNIHRGLKTLAQKFATLRQVTPLSAHPQDPTTNTQDHAHE